MIAEEIYLHFQIHFLSSFFWGGKDGVGEKTGNGVRERGGSGKGRGGLYSP